MVNTGTLKKLEFFIGPSSYVNIWLGSESEQILKPDPNLKRVVHIRNTAHSSVIGVM